MLYTDPINGPQLYMGNGTADPTGANNPIIWLTGGVTTITAARQAGGMVIDDAGGGLTLSVTKIGFFGTTPVAEQVSGGTLAGVIAGLVALGLFSS